MTFMHFARNITKIFGLVAAMAFLAACSANTVVPLRYQPSTPQGAPTCTQTITLLPFADKRADTDRKSVV